MTITLPPELEQALVEQAERQGTTPELIIVDSLQRLYLPPTLPSAEQSQTLADYWADYIGTIDSREVMPGGANLSQNTGRRFAELMAEKYRKGKQ